MYRKSKREAGSAIVAALGVATIVLLLGLASIFMSWTNTKIAQNIKLHTQARFASEGGLELAIAAFEKGMSIPSSSNVGAFNVKLSSQTKGDLTEIRAEATGPHNSAYESKAVLGQGILKLPVILSRELDLDDSAVFKGGIWAEEGWDFDTDQVSFKTSDGEPIAHENSPVFASNAADDYTCPEGSHESAYCTEDEEPLATRKTDPINIPTPPYNEIQNWVDSQIATPNSPSAPIEPSELSGCPNGNTIDGTLVINSTNVSMLGDTLCYKKIKIDLNESDLTLDNKTLYVEDSIESIGNHSLTLSDSTLQASSNDNSDGIKLALEALNIEGDVQLIAKNGGTITITTDDNSASDKGPNLTIRQDSNLLAKAGHDIKIQLDDSRGELLLAENSGAHLTSVDGQIQITNSIKKIDLAQGSKLFAKAKSNIQIQLDDGDNTTQSYFTLHEASKVHLTSTEGQIQITAPRNLILSNDSEFLAKALNDILVQSDDDQNSAFTLHEDSKAHFTSDDGKIEIKDFAKMTLSQSSELLAKALNNIQIQLEDSGDFDSQGTVILDGEKLEIKSGRASFRGDTSLIAGPNPDDDGDIQIQVKEEPGVEMPCQDGELKALLVARGKIELKDEGLGKACAFVWSQDDVVVDNNTDDFSGMIMTQGEATLKAANGNTFSGISESGLKNTLIDHLITNNDLDLESLKIPASHPAYSIISRK